MGRRRVERSLGNHDTRVSEEYPIGEDAIQNLAAGEGIVHTPERWQRGRLYLFDEVKDALVPAETTDRTESGTSQTDFER